MKRAIDLLLASLMLIATIPLVLVISLFVRILLGRPILFRQNRPGLGGEPFEILKFRTMKNQYAQDGNLLPDSQRLTRFGRVLRASSMDELPELWNVLCGDMSLVGPRPLLMEYVPLYTPEQARRHEVRPGITGWAQVNGRNALSWEDKFQLDVWYVDHRSVLLDVWILVLTVKQVVLGRGVTASGSATMPRFTGSQEDNV